MEGAESLGRLQLGRRRIRSEIDEPLARARIRQRIHDSRIEFLDDDARRSFWCPNAMPGSKVKPWQPRFVHRRNVRRSR